VGWFDVWQLKSAYEDSYFAAAYLMNADGSCATRLTYGGAARDVEQASWRPQPSSTLPRLHCADLFVTVSTRRSHEVALTSPLSDVATVENRGDRVAQSVVMTLAVGAIVPVSASGRGARCRVARKLVTCALGRIAPGEKRTVAFVGRSPAVGGSRAFVIARAASRTAEGDLSNNLDVVAHDVANCTLLGTAARETIVGTSRRDLICGRDGNDTIRSLAGDDWINAGRGDDTIDPGPGRDYVIAKPGNDQIFAADGARDRIQCGEGTDRVIADARDVLSADCDDVTRR
jgi:Ca2+-binding RTX toxin-like protein